MSYGIVVFDEKSVETLGMSDFSLQRLFQLVLPPYKRGGAGHRSDYLVLDIDGYDPAKCFVTITPKVYAPFSQGTRKWGVVPTYRELGGTSVGICTYENYIELDGSTGKWRDWWREDTVECVIEAVRFA